MEITSDNFGQCKCCLKKTYLKNMWEPLKSNGDIEMYGQMLVDCFGIDWTIYDMEDDNMCEVCISKLKVCFAFKKQIKESQAALQPKVAEVVAPIEENEDGWGTDEVLVEIPEQEDSCDATFEEDTTLLGVEDTTNTLEVADDIESTSSNTGKKEDNASQNNPDNEIIASIENSDMSDIDSSSENIESADDTPSENKDRAVKKEINTKVIHSKKEKDNTNTIENDSSKIPIKKEDGEETIATLLRRKDYSTINTILKKANTGPSILRKEHSPVGLLRKSNRSLTSALENFKKERKEGVSLEMQEIDNETLIGRKEGIINTETRSKTSIDTNKMNKISFDVKKRKVTHCVVRNEEFSDENKRRNRKQDTSMIVKLEDKEYEEYDETEAAEEVVETDVNNVDEYEVEFLEEEFLEEFDGNKESEPVKKKKPKKLPKHWRTMEFTHFREEDVTKALDAVRSKLLTKKQASVKFNVPLKMIAKKLSAEHDIEDINRMKIVIKAINAIVRHTNAIPFRVYKGFRCIFCPPNESFSGTPEELRLHTQSHTRRIPHLDYLLVPNSKNRMIRIDVHNLTCKCEEDISWLILPDHLKSNHRVIGIEEAWKKIVPFELNSSEMVCVIPSCDFIAYFTTMDNHMNKHYKNYICEYCDKTYITLSRLKTHLNNHNTGKHQCKECGLVLKSVIAKTTHMKRVHKLKIPFKCFICSERFISRIRREIHVKRYHKDKLESMGKTCKECDKKIWEWDYQQHITKTHKRYLCTQCGKYFARMSLKRHILSCEVEKLCLDIRPGLDFESFV